MPIDYNLLISVQHLPRLLQHRFGFSLLYSNIEVNELFGNVRPLTAVLLFTDCYDCGAINTQVLIVRVLLGCLNSN